MRSRTLFESIITIASLGQESFLQSVAGGTGSQVLTYLRAGADPKAVIGIGATTLSRAKGNEFLRDSRVPGVLRSAKR
jgi:hypothetical protein